MDAPHPTDETLGLYRQGKLADDRAELVKAHLETCAFCWRRGAAMSSESYLNWVHGDPKRADQDQSETEETRRGLTKLTMAPPPADSLPSGLANHRDYEIRRELGRGGMGVVYLAHNTLMGRDEVLKVMGRHLAERAGALDRFVREIRAVAKLRHSNIVSAYSAFRLDESIVFAMEYVDGLDLSRVVKAKGPLSVSNASNFVYQTALGLQHAFEEGLVHRDIKPGNLMLARKGEKATIKVLDFGLAKATREEKLEGDLTAQGQMLGTPDFIAPEQIMDSKTADIRADIYSLGGTLYYLLTGRPPFLSDSFYGICQAHIAQSADPLNLIRPDVPSELAALVATMLAKEPARRPQTPGEVAAALTPFFKKARATVPTARTDQPQTPAAFDLTQPNSDQDPEKNAAGMQKAPETTVDESRWESLVDLRSNDDSLDGAPTADPKPSPSWKTWPIILAATALILIALGVAVVSWVSNKRGGETRVASADYGPGQDDPTEPIEPTAAIGIRPADATPIAEKTPQPPQGPIAAAHSQTQVTAQDNTPRGFSTSENPLRSTTRSVYVDDFHDSGSGWPQGDGKGYGSGVYFIDPASGWAYWRCPRRIRTYCTVEISGRLKADRPITQGAWGLVVGRGYGTTDALRGLMIKLNHKGELFLMPHPDPKAKEFKTIDPTIGPIVHPAIKPGDEPNALLLVVKTRSLEIFVNSVRVCGPVLFDFDLIPSTLSLAAFDGRSNFRAEFDRIEMREFTDGGSPSGPATNDSIRLATRSVYIDDFQDSGSGWSKGDNQGYNAGNYFVDPQRNWAAWRSPRRIRTDSALEVVGRLKFDGSQTNKGSWGVLVGKGSTAAHRGFMIKINGMGELFLSPNPFPEAKEFITVDPTIGPIVHPAIKPGGQPNTLFLAMRKRSLEIYVNSVRVCEPVTFGFDLTPAFFDLGAFDGPASFRAEFDKVEVREFIDGKQRLSPTAFNTIRSATRPIYFDDFSDPNSRWIKSEISGYSGGLYFVNARSAVAYFKCPGRLQTDSAVEIIGRLKSERSSQRGAWAVILNRDIGSARRGFMVKINGKGELYLMPNPHREASDFSDIDPTIGPIVHPAIKPANQINRLLLVIRKRSVEIFVNSVPVYEPVAFDFDLTPSFLQVSSRDGPGDFRAEFDSVAIREFIHP